MYFSAKDQEMRKKKDKLIKVLIPSFFSFLKSPPFLACARPQLRHAGPLAAPWELSVQLVPLVPRPGTESRSLRGKRGIAQSPDHWASPWLFSLQVNLSQ